MYHHQMCHHQMYHHWARNHWNFLNAMPPTIETIFWPKTLSGALVAPWQKICTSF
jgi:hypothetical protein